MMELTERDRRMILHGITLARIVLKRAGCHHQRAILTYHDVTVDAWGLKIPETSVAEETANFESIVVDINNAVSAKRPDWVDESGHPWRKH